jgi:hypothetical protein
MTAVTRPRGPLPSRVYWFRRLLVLAVAVGLVVGIARLLGGGGGEGGSAALVAAREGAGTPAATPSTGPGAGRTGGPAVERRERPRGGPSKPAKRKLPKPDGPCDGSDVLVNPVAEGAHVNQPIEIVLEVTTAESPACTWEVSPDTVFLSITSDGAAHWSSQECPASIPTEQVVARRVKPARVTVVWDGRESAPGCPATTGWMLAGEYVATAIARGSVDATSNPLVLADAVAPTITASPTPTESKPRRRR